MNENMQKAIALQEQAMRTRLKKTQMNIEYHDWGMHIIIKSPTPWAAIDHVCRQISQYVKRETGICFGVVVDLDNFNREYIRIDSRLPEGYSIPMDRKAFAI